MMRSDKFARRLAWKLCALVILSTVLAAIVILRIQPVGDNLFDFLGSFVSFIMLALFGIVGALIIAHQPRNIVGWLLMIIAMIVLYEPLDVYFNSLVQAPAQPTILTYLGLWVYMWGWLWYIFPIFFIPLFFPSGRLLSPRWRWVVILGLGLCLFFISIATFVTHFPEHNDAWSVPNPIGFIPAESFPMVPWSVALLSFVALCTASIFVRYRRAQTAERQQIKWLLYVVTFFAVSYAIGFVEVGGPIGALFGVISTLSPLLLPIAIGVAILRYRLYDIDIIIRRTLVYAILTGLLALVYFGLVILLQSVFESLSSEQSPIAIVISTLVIAALFAPLRRRVQAVIDRRFFRKKYDAQQVLAQFAQTARDETEVKILTKELGQVMQETMQPEFLGLWLKNDNS